MCLLEEFWGLGCYYGEAQSCVPQEAPKPAGDVSGDNRSVDVIIGCRYEKCGAQSKAAGV